jgi:hypothetical protein
VHKTLLFGHAPDFVEIRLVTKKTCYKIKDQSFWTPLTDLKNLVKELNATKSKTGHLGHLGLTCETCKRTHATKSKTGIWDFGLDL